jgi:hypothetical protein
MRKERKFSRNNGDLALNWKGAIKMPGDNDFLLLKGILYSLLFQRSNWINSMS